MTPWFKSNPTYFRHERDAITERQPSLVLEILSAGTQLTQTHKLTHDRAVCRGMYVLNVPESDRHYDYSIIVATRSTHPRDIPLLFCNDPKLPIDIPDRHIINAGQACLGVNTEIKAKWQSNRGIIGFFEDFVEPFLSWQLFYEAHGHAGPFGQRSHGAKGILEFYAEFLGLPYELHIPMFMEMLGRLNKPKGHEPCPCGSGRKLRYCHASLVWDTWGKLDRKDIHEDLASLRKSTCKGFLPAI